MIKYPVPEENKVFTQKVKMWQVSRRTRTDWPLSTAVRGWRFRAREPASKRDLPLSWWVRAARDCAARA